MNYRGLIFDLDGVIVDTAKYHYLAWKEIAKELEYEFSEKDNERLKGVSRQKSFEIILELAGSTMDESSKESYCKRKNDIYVKYISELSKKDILPNVQEFLLDAREREYKIALGSASKNAIMILEKLEILDLFNAIIDGNQVTNAKPNPEVFLKAAYGLNLSPDQCIVFEDSFSSIEAAIQAGMKTVGIGEEDTLGAATIVMKSFEDTDIGIVENLLSAKTI